MTIEQQIPVDKKRGNILFFVLSFHLLLFYLFFIKSPSSAPLKKSTNHLVVRSVTIQVEKPPKKMPTVCKESLTQTVQKTVIKKNYTRASGEKNGKTSPQKSSYSDKSPTYLCFFSRATPKERSSF